jgi:uncharacterized protein YodC (DUF2158 family)
MLEKQATSQVMDIMSAEKIEPKIKQGDVVRLKTSGPRMVADTIDWNKGTSSQHLPQIRCVWFVGSTLHQGNFNSNSLVLVNSRYNTNIEKTI